MALHVTRMPDLGEGIAEVELVKWHVAPGDRVVEDQVLADVMTDKASVEIPSPVAGTVMTLGGEVGQMLAVGADLIHIETGAGNAQAAPRVTAKPPLAANPASPFPAAPAAPPRVAPDAPPAAKSTAHAAKQRPIASPAVRARAWELGIALEAVAASGTAGRIMQADLDAHIAGGGARSRSAAHAAPRTDAKPGATHEIKIVGLRRVIAQKMQDAKRRIPHFTYVEEVDVSELEALRLQLNTKWGGDRAHLTLLPFLIRAMTQALREFPEVNARFDDQTGIITRHESVHMGIATQTDAGLLVPVLRDAQSLDLWRIATEVERLSSLARSGKAVRDELSGSTITLTSLGKLGGIISTPIVNHPEVAIVGVNRIVQRPVIRGGAVVARQMMNLSSSFDHRVVDGANAAAFVQAVRAMLEQPALLFIN